MKTQTLIAIAAAALGLGAIAAVPVLRTAKAETPLVSVRLPEATFAPSAHHDDSEMLAVVEPGNLMQQHGPGGPGGPGGQPGDSQGMPPGAPMPPMGGGPLAMLHDPKVIEELKLTPEQVTKIHEAMRELRPEGRRAPDRGEQGPRPGEPAPPAPEMREKVDELLKAAMSAEQFARFKQLEIQFIGPRIALDPKIGETLGITEDQRRQIDEILRSERPQAGPDGRRGQRGPDSGSGEFAPPPPDSGRPSMPERRKQLDEQLLAVFTPDQRSKWQKMIGEKFEFSPPPPMHAPGPGGPTGPGGPGGSGGHRGGPGGGGGGEAPLPPDQMISL